MAATRQILLSITLLALFAKMAVYSDDTPPASGEPDSTCLDVGGYCRLQTACDAFDAQLETRTGCKNQNPIGKYVCCLQVWNYYNASEPCKDMCRKLTDKCGSGRVPGKCNKGEACCVLV